MDQFILIEKTLLKMIEDAFNAGYDNPNEFAEEEISRIYNRGIKKASLTSCGKKPEKMKVKHI